MEFNDLIVMFAALVITILLGWMIKRQTWNFRRPNGKKGGGLVSMHTVIAFAILTVITLSFQNMYLTVLVSILAYMVARSRITEQQHYYYQVLLGVLLGIGMPYLIYSLLDKETIQKLTSKMKWSKHSSHHEERRIADMPDNAKDERHQADEAPELKIDDEMNDLDYLS